MKKVFHIILDLVLEEYHSLIENGFGFFFFFFFFEIISIEFFLSRIEVPVFLPVVSGYSKKLLKINKKKMFFSSFFLEKLTI